MTDIRLPAYEGVAIAILISILRRRDTIDAAGSIVDGAIDRCKFQEWLDDQERQPIGGARNLLGAEDRVDEGIRVSVPAPIEVSK